MTSSTGRRRLRVALLLLSTSAASVLASYSPAAAGPRSAAASPAAAVAAAASTTLHDRVHVALRGSTASVVGVHVVVGGLGTVVTHHGSTPLKPASTQKSFIGLTALQKLTPGRRLYTYVRATGRPDTAGTIHGHLVLQGTGDPTLTSAHLGELARAIRAKGIRTVTGSLYADDTYFDRAHRAPGWKPSFVPGESGPLSALVVDRNRWRTDSSYIAEPAVPNAGRFRAALNRAGVSVVGSTRLGRPSATQPSIVRHGSATVATLVARMLKYSDNMTAELLLKRLGAQVGSAGSTAAGAAAVRAHMRTLRVPVGTFADGSGLSSLDRQTPAGEVALLGAGAGTAVRTTFRSSLARACVDGTLASRMCGTSAAGRVSAKTGTLNGVRVLSGYTTTRSGRAVRFSFMLSGCGNGRSCRNAIDRAVVSLAAFAG